MRNEFVPVSIRFSPEMYEWLRKRAYEAHTPVNAIVREAVDAVRSAEGKKAERMSKAGKK